MYAWIVDERAYGPHLPTSNNSIDHIYDDPHMCVVEDNLKLYCGYNYTRLRMINRI